MTLQATMCRQRVQRVEGGSVNPKDVSGWGQYLVLLGPHGVDEGLTILQVFGRVLQLFAFCGTLEG